MIITTTEQMGNYFAVKVFFPSIIQNENAQNVLKQKEDMRSAHALAVKAIFKAI